ncbi:triacylglycerol lipase [Nocardioides humilatus]|uniref:Triacylglycerol lipase n=1 Tax=Nocardioides humilatus TaxID=2607660 RepID=A0A5B1LLN7_9ACTN|nr:lipase family protein [Nocardioides humilatus]KAA1421394.1 triacylglycerol lipase [Nocardioides humilatus]
MNRRLGALVSAVAISALGTSLAVLPAEARTTPAPARSAAGPLDDPFFDYTGATPLRDVKPGTVLKTRTVPYSVQGVDLPLEAVQLLYRTRNARGRAVANVTSVVRPILPLGGAKVVSYQSFYDSLNPADQPSVAIAGGTGLGPGIANVETTLIAPLLLAGFTINIPDTEGPTADFAAGPEYGYTTLDSLRAITRAEATGVGRRTPVGLIGYSGGAIGSEWAAELAHDYAPDVARRIVGTAIGGILVHPGHNLHYMDGSLAWAGVLPMALIGLSRAYDVDLARYANEEGKALLRKMRHASITQAIGTYPGLTWKSIVKPRYATPEAVRPLVRIANGLIMGSKHTPTAPMFMGQGTGGVLEGTQPHPVFGSGDGVMVAGDVRSLARRYCSRGLDVVYHQYPLSHFTSIATWLPQAYTWLLGRFGDGAAPSSCGDIKRGNSLAPLKYAG